MKRYGLIAILTFGLLFFNAQLQINAQQPTLSAKQRVFLIEQKLKQQNKVYKVIGENNVAPNGKIVQKITSPSSFEILALPLVDSSQTQGYTKDFIGRLFTSKGLKISEVSSHSGMRVMANVPESYGEAKQHSFEFINPNNNAVKVRFYYVQD